MQTEVVPNLENFYSDQYFVILAPNSEDLVMSGTIIFLENAMILLFK